MYDIRIFLEENGQFGAKVNLGKEYIYGLGNTNEELLKNIKEGIEFSLGNKEKNIKESRVCSYFNEPKKELVCH